jgi:hypothetical protein
MNRYVQPEYSVLTVKSNDIITTSNFKVNEDSKNNKVDFVVNPNVVFGF